MRLSEAMRKGCEGTRKIKGFLEDGGDGFCAMGAALRGLGVDITLARYEDCFPAALAIAMQACPECGLSKCPDVLAGDDGHNLICTVVHLNNAHEWTREAIADWVQAQEAIHGIGQDENPIQREVRELIEA